MKILFRVLFVLVILASARTVHALEPVVETVNSSGTVGGVTCTTGTAVQIDVSPFLNVGKMGSGVNRAWVRVQNQNASYSIWFGFASTVSTDTASGYLGEQLASGSPGQSATYPVGKDIALYCKAADGAGANGARISVAQFGYK